MSSTADAVIDAIRAGHEQLLPVVASLTPEELTGPSPDSEWDVSQVVSHLGSGAVITQATLAAAVAGEPNPGQDANRKVWSRWDAMTPEQRQQEFLTADTELLAAYDALDDTQRSQLRTDLGFLPAPVDLATAARFRLNELALHSWDVRVTRDPAAVVEPSAVPHLLEQLTAMLGWIAKPANLDGEHDVLVTLSDPERAFGLHLGEAASIGEPPSDPDAELTLPAEAWLRLATGRLAPEHTPDDVSVTGGLSLDDLRTVFAGY